MKDGPLLPPARLTRRSLFQAAGAGAAMAGADACSRGPAEHIVPYVVQPEDVVPSVATTYATTMTAGGVGVGMIVESHEGRPTKAEGNRAHPASGGALGAFGQASVRSLYDPSRGTAVTLDGSPATWTELAAALAKPAPPGKSIHVLLEPTSAPHLIEQVARARGRGDLAVHFDAPLAPVAAWEGARRAFGRVVEPRWDFTRAEVVLSLDADFLAATSGPLTWPRDWASRRRLAGPAESMSRLYVVEARLSVTGMSADERRAVPSREIGDLTATLLRQLRGAGGGDGWVRALAADLLAHRGACAVLVGDAQPPEVHLLGHAMNELLGNAGRTVTYGPSPIFEAGGESFGLSSLVRAIDASEVAALVVVGGDPAYTAPADLELARRIGAVPVTAFVGLYENHTSAACRGYVPEAHFLEAWGDARAFDGTTSIAQPLILPLIEGRTAAQVLAALAGDAKAASRDLVRAYWRSRVDGDFDGWWQRALVRGFVEGSASPPIPVAIDTGAVERILRAPPRLHAPLEIVTFADSRVHDGRFANDDMLQELPDPVTKLTWDNAALLARGTAARLGVGNGDVLEVRVRGRSARIPALVVPGTAEDVIAVAIGYGQSVPGRASTGVGANAYALRDSHALWADDASATSTGGRADLALAQEHDAMEGRPIVLRRTLGEYRADPSFAVPLDQPLRQLYALRPDAPHQWGMTIDLNACTGCSACVVACSVENNVPAVGKAGVLKHRQMQWLRIDRYYLERQAAVVQPMLCQHCEHAPCEYVCPVNATVHSHDGLNEMVYNRCVGTRFCSNNCPYKVRRFNFFNYATRERWPEPLRNNPEVTVRERGVMEKCTYCVQRIRAAEIRATREGRTLRDGDVVTACQQTCPTGAIVFGDIADAGTRVSATRRNGRIYQVLHELGTLPRTRYLARVVNPNPEARG